MAWAAKDKNKISITKIEYENEIKTTPSEIVDSFNKFFTNIGQNLADSIDNDDPNAFKQFLGNPVKQSFNLCETSAPEVKYFMSKIIYLPITFDWSVELKNI